MSGLCRLCAETRSLEKMSEISDPELNLEQKLVDCCQWTHLKELELDVNLPQHICIVCIEKLEQCWLFIESVTNAQYKLIQIIKNNDGVEDTSTMYDYYYGDRVDNLPEPPVEIRVYVEVDENQQISTEYIEENPKECSPTESDDAQTMTISDKSDKKIAEKRKTRSASNKSIQMEVQQNEGDQSSNITETSFHASNFTKKFLSLLGKDDRNEDGSVDSGAIQRLGLVNWMVLQHQCRICLTCFCSNYELKAHFTTEHSITDLRYICSICKSNKTNNKTYARRSYLHKHIMRHHFLHLKYCCMRCNKFFWDLAKLREHKATHMQRPSRLDKFAVMCHECGGFFDSESTLRNHAQSHLPDDHKPIFECYICKRTYACKNSLKYHWPDHVGGRKRFKCTTCGSEFGRIDSLTRHEKIHKDIFPYLCLECGKKFRFKKGLQIHKNVHSNSKPYGCPIANCGYRCSDSSNVFKHIRQKHGLPSGHGLKIVHFKNNSAADNNS